MKFTISLQPWRFQKGLLDFGVRYDEGDWKEYWIVVGRLLISLGTYKGPMPGELVYPEDKEL